MPDTRTAWDAEYIERIAKKAMETGLTGRAADDLVQFALDALRTLAEQEARLKELEAVLAAEWNQQTFAVVAAARDHGANYWRREMERAEGEWHDAEAKLAALRSQLTAAEQREKEWRETSDKLAASNRELRLLYQAQEGDRATLAARVRELERDRETFGHIVAISVFRACEKAAGLEQGAAEWEVPLEQIVRAATPGASDA